MNNYLCKYCQHSLSNHNGNCKEEGCICNRDVYTDNKEEDNEDNG